jgi:hypothetical protein
MHIRVTLPVSTGQYCGLVSSWYSRTWIEVQVICAWILLLPQYVYKLEIVADKSNESCKPAVGCL